MTLRVRKPADFSQLTSAIRLLLSGMALLVAFALTPIAMASEQAAPFHGRSVGPAGALQNSERAGHTVQIASEALPVNERSLTAAAKEKWRRFWWGQSSRDQRQGYCKLVLGLLGGLVFILAAPRRGPAGRSVPVTYAIAGITAVMLCAVGIAMVLLRTRTAGWAIPAGIGFGVSGIAWTAFALATRGRPWWPALVRRGAYITIIVSGAVAWTGFGVFHNGQVVHTHDFFHYYIGSKYFEENRYTRIYECTIVAENREGLTVGWRRVRNLETNQGGHSYQILQGETDCLDVFSAERWASFRRDVRELRRAQTPERWEAIFNDKGYNATPLWTSFGSPLSNGNWQVSAPLVQHATVPPRGTSGVGGAGRAEPVDAASRNLSLRIALLAIIDPLLYAGALILVYWAFGLEACALMALLLGVGAPWDFRYTGGAFGRVPWFFAATAAVCLIRKGYPAWGGAALVMSAMLRLFPAALFGGVAMVAAERLVRRRSITRAHKHLALGALLALAVLLPVSMTTGGPSIWPEFLENTERHASTPLTNHAGVRALISLDMDKRAEITRNDHYLDPFKTWRESRVETFKQRKHYYWTVATLLFLLVWAASRKMADWERVIASTLLIFTLVDLTSYYLLFMVLWAPLVARNTRYTVLAISMAMLTQLPLMLASQEDLRVLWQSVIVLAFMCTVLTLVLFDRARVPDEDLGQRAAGSDRPGNHPQVQGAIDT